MCCAAIPDLPSPHRLDETRAPLLLRLHPATAALDAAIASGGTGGFGEQFGQLDAVLRTPA